MANDSPQKSPNRVTSVEFLYDVAVRAYVQRESQESIARELGVHNSTVSRALRRATDLGMVHVTISPPTNLDRTLTERIRGLFGISDCVVVQESRHGLAGATPALLDKYLKNGEAIGVSWGSTLSEVVLSLPSLPFSDIDVRPLIGGFGRVDRSTQPHEIASLLANKFTRGTVSYLEAPALLSSADSRAALREAVNPSLQHAAECDVALLGIGSLEKDAALFRSGHLSEDDRQRLISKGAVASICAHFLAADGSPVVDAVEDRLVAVDLAGVRAIPTAIAFVSGPEKVESIAATLRSGVVDVLVTDSETAMQLVELGETGTAAGQK